MSKTKRTLLLAVVSMLNLLVSSLGGLIVGRIILSRLGSDYNGLNAIIAQFLTVVTLAEGGYTTAALVAMLQPYGAGDMARLDQLYAESSRRFRQLGWYALGFGLVFAAVYSAMVRSDIPYATILAVLCIALASSVFNLWYVTKVRILFQVTQTEHLYVLITLLCNLCSQCAMAAVLLRGGSIVLARCAYLFFTVLAGLTAHAVFFRRAACVHPESAWDGVKRIHGTRDVMVGKVVSILYNSSSVFFLSVFANTRMTSVYAVYNSIISAVSSAVNIAVSSPQNALGLVLQEPDWEHARSVVQEIEFLVILLLTVLFAALGGVLLPFVGLYTSGVTDAKYVDPFLGALLLMTAYLQLIHVPSGLCIQLSGRFAVARNIQMATLGILLFGDLILGACFGFYGILWGILLCNTGLVVMEIGDNHLRIFPGSLKAFLGMLLPNFLLMWGLMAAFQPIAARCIRDYLSFFLCGCCMLAASAALTLLVNAICFPRRIKALFRRALSLIHRA